MNRSQTEQRLRRLEDARAIEELKYKYAEYCDTGYDLDGFRSIFSTDARWSANGFGDFTGHDAICEFFSELAPTIVSVLHYVTSPRISIDESGDTASGRFYLLCLSRSRSRKDPTKIDFVATLGTYADRFVRIDGRWLLKEVIVDVKHVTRL